MGAIVDCAKGLGWPVIGWCWCGDNFQKDEKSEFNMNMIRSTTSGTNTSFDKYQPGLSANYAYTVYFNVIYNKLKVIQWT
jgi:hypothetical protein